MSNLRITDYKRCRAVIAVYSHYVTETEPDEDYAAWKLTKLSEWAAELERKRPVRFRLRQARPVVIT
ncbi:hypothetical protein ACX93W_01635 [Paenibacillus sp. CAU 1782]